MKNLFDLTGKLAVVTGASSGLGRDAAYAYAQQGADVVVMARRYDRLLEVKEKIEKEYGRRAMAIRCDITVEEDIESAVQQIIEVFGRIDILLNNAGTNALGDVMTLPTSDWDNVVNTNLRGCFLTSKYIVPHMIKQQYGKIVNIASINAIMCDKEDWIQRPVYNATKAGVVGLTKAMATHLAKHNITVNAVGPGLFATEMTESLLAVEPYMNMINSINPSSRYGNKGELNGAVLFFSSDASSFVQGQFVIVSGGMELV